MTARVQKRLAVGAALSLAVLFVGANLHLLSVAVKSQPECREAAGLTPAKRAC